MELDQLRYFLQTAERGSFTRAAEDLLMSQPALSRSMQKLEEELGQPVFERKTRSIALTEAGTLLQARAQQILAILEDTKAEITDDGESGRVRVGAIPTIAPYFLPTVLQRFSAAFPKATLIVQENTTDLLLKSCTQGEIDLAIVALPDEAHCLTDNIVSFCRQRSFQPVAVERTSQLTMVQELVSLSHGVSMIPAMARLRDESARRIYRSLANPKPKRTIAVVWNPYRFQSRLLKAFREHLHG